ncbi:hypothetical protein [Escherichia coli]|jgi:ankyrin repeat protein|uniref:hypothetical protein n=3 Tax=Escherichia coli TaxID=562 RepID=UPI0004D61253|nr:hypothetical protein [Escherichia coli]EFE7862857.1 hypothetical protein [Escherichia coli]EFH6998899.1 hypothetical protein [Escherichia coli]EFL2424201.1 hypothetical protein [Escherichia coli]EGM8114108.1 hypothetical protein [Escherichia coli]EHJ8674443.1 hypothetical protein [Escherichia coli]
MLLDFMDFFTDHSLINLVDKYGRTPIFYSDDYYFTKFLIRNGANINHIDNFGRTLLFYRWPKNEELIDEIFNSGVDINIKDYKGLTAFSFSLFAQQPDVFLKHISKLQEKEIVIGNLYPTSSEAIKKLINANIKIRFNDVIKIHYPLILCQQEVLSIKELMAGDIHFSRPKIIISEYSNITSITNFDNIFRKIS